MRRSTVSSLVPLPFLSLVVAAVVSLVPGCFSPQTPSCAFTCVEAPHACPSGFTCGADRICHNDDNPGECIFSAPDAGTDGNGTDSER